MTKLRFNGVTQPIEEWAADYGIPCKLIHSRLRRGWPVERAITEPMQVRRGDKLKDDDLKDVQPPLKSELKPVPKLAPRLEIMSPRLRPRERLRRPTPAYADHSVTFNGRTMSVAEWADEIGITRVALYARLRKGWPLERALTERSGGPAERAPVYTYNGDALTLAEWAAKLGIPKNTLQVRIGRGWCVEAALGTPLGRSPQPTRSKSVSTDSPGAGVGRA